MSESVLNALMQLFALVGDIRDDTVVSSREKDIVRQFLSRHLSNEQVEQYMKLLEKYLGTYVAENIEKGSKRDLKRISLNAMRILSICEKISLELEQRQKVYVLVRLMDYISHGTDVTETEFDFLQTVSSAFNIPLTEYESMKWFIMEGDGGLEGIPGLIVTDNRKDTGIPHHIFNENMKGRIMFLNIRSTNTWLMRYEGYEVLYLNGQNIGHGEIYVFDTGSSIRGSGIKSIHYSEIAGYLSSASHRLAVLRADEVNFRFRNSDNGVHDLTFEGRSGEFVGIIGGSGVGKSTTLSILSGTLRPQMGRILVNGYDLYNEEDRDKLRGVIGFVPQDDLLIEELTVYQNLYYNARMCLSNLPEENQKKAVERMLNDLDLSAARDLKVGNPLDKVISGGQRKRINIALELMREPTILFVDEPTSGLSSVDSEMVMSLLKDLTFKGKLVIVNIHQPSSDIYKMFDRIMIIDRGGYQVFCGNPAEAIVYFKVQTNHANPDEDQCPRCGNVVPEQILQIIESKVLDEHGKPTRTRRILPSEWAEKFKVFYPAHIKNAIEKHQLPVNNFSIPGKFGQTLIFFTRDVLSKLANSQYIAISLLGPPLLALLLSYFIRTPAGEDYLFSENGNIPSYLFMCVITAMFFGLMGSAEEIVKDRKILKREAFLNLSWFSYLNSKVFILFILSAIQTLSFAVVGNLILGIKGMTLSYWMVLFATSCFANLLGLNLSSAFRSVITIYILIPFIIIPQLLFSGVIVKFDKLNTGTREYVPAIGEAMIIRWAFEAIAVEQFRNNAYSSMFFDHRMKVSEAEKNLFIVEALTRDLRINQKFRDSLRYRFETDGNFRKLVHHSDQLALETGISLPQEIRSKLTHELFDAEAFRAMYFFLDDSLKGIYNRQLTDARDMLDQVERAVEDSLGKDKKVELMDRHENNELERLLLNRTASERTIETNDKIIPTHDPAYIKAVSPVGRAHFYAPVKTFLVWEIGTFTFNLIFIWLTTLVLYIILYFRLLEKAVTFISSLKLNTD
jgi:ABC transport system ATP-binding/permease protein